MTELVTIKFEDFNVGIYTYSSLAEWERSGKRKEYKNYIVSFIDKSGREFEVESIDKNLDLESKIYKTTKADYDFKINSWNKSIKLLEELKDLNKKSEYVTFNFVDNKGRYFVNDDTENINSAANYDFGYCVYGQLIEGGQVDSRYNTDREIAKAISIYFDMGAGVVRKPVL